MNPTAPTTAQPSADTRALDDAPATERVAFLLRLRPDRVADYLVAHETVWPEMLAALTSAGWRNYSLFLDAEHAQIVGYVETDDFEQAQRRVEATDANTSWQAHMAEYFHPDAGGRMTRLPQYFHLD